MDSNEHTSRADGAASILDKVRKLLAKAERTDNPHEADAFARKAAQLVAAHRLDLTSSTARGEIEIRRLDLQGGPYVGARLQLLLVVARTNDCRVITESTGRGTVANVVGVSTDLEAVELLYTSLHAQASVGMAKLHRPTSGATRQARRSFLLGFALQVGLMLAEERAAAEAQAGRALHDTLLPALRSRRSQIDDFIRAEFGRLTTRRRPGLTSADGWDEGIDAASQSDVGRRKVRATPAIGSAA